MTATTMLELIYMDNKLKAYLCNLLVHVPRMPVTTDIILPHCVLGTISPKLLSHSSSKISFKENDQTVSNAEEL
jgi:hypothetical protein